MLPPCVLITRYSYYPGSESYPNFSIIAIYPVWSWSTTAAENDTIFAFSLLLIKRFHISSPRTSVLNFRSSTALLDQLVSFLAIMPCQWFLWPREGLPTRPSIALNRTIPLIMAAFQLETSLNPKKPTWRRWREIGTWRDGDLTLGLARSSKKSIYMFSASMEYLPPSLLEILEE